MEDAQPIRPLSHAFACLTQVQETTTGAPHDPSLRELRPPSETFGRLWFMLGDEDELFIENIKSDGNGWGTAMVKKLQSMYPGRTRWTASSINAESKPFWEKMQIRLGIRIQSGAIRPDHRSS